MSFKRWMRRDEWTFQAVILCKNTVYATVTYYSVLKMSYTSLDDDIVFEHCVWTFIKRSSQHISFMSAPSAMYPERKEGFEVRKKVTRLPRERTLKRIDCGSPFHREGTQGTMRTRYLPILTRRTKRSSWWEDLRERSDVAERKRRIWWQVFWSNTQSR